MKDEDRSQISDQVSNLTSSRLQFEIWDLNLRSVVILGPSDQRQLDSTLPACYIGAAF
jgi:hypothetical protein